MHLPDLTIRTESEDHTTQLGTTLAKVLGPGDLLTLSGPLGVGKSHLARAIIRHFLQDPLAEVPSPSYTLVNTYTIGALEIWHADLYRLGDVSELTEIGLDDAVEDALVLIEWPDRWPDLPPRRMELKLSFSDDATRMISVQTHGQGWEPALTALEGSQ